MRRFFAENCDLSSGSVTLSGDEARHISNVLRMRPGDRVLLINGKGTEAAARISAITDASVELVIEQTSAGESEPEICVTLFQCLPKQGKMELIIQKCVELGVKRIVPTVSRRCIVKLDGKDGKLIRWNKVSAEAVKQSGRSFIPEVCAPEALDKLSFEDFDLVLIPYENEDELTLKQAIRSHTEARNIAVIIGPEGGFEPSEVDGVLSKGGVAVSLGPRILRTETAGMAALAQIMYEFEQ